MFGAGTSLCVGPKGVLEIGEKFRNSAQMTIICMKSIIIGDNVLTSWDTSVLDTDFHYIKNLSTGSYNEKELPVIIGNNSWLCMGCTVLKGSVIPDACIVSSKTVVNKQFTEPHCILMGNPAIIVAKNRIIDRTKK